MDIQNVQQKKIIAATVFGIIAIVFFISGIISASGHNNTCGATQMSQPAIKSGIEFTPLSQSVDDNAVNILYVEIENLDSYSKTITYQKYSCRCQQHLGDPDFSFITCLDYWPFEEFAGGSGWLNSACYLANETITLGGNEKKNIQISVSQYQNMKCGSFQLDLALVNLNGVDMFESLVWSVADLCADCPEVKTCNDNNDCNDGVYCNGAEVCNLNTNTCESGNTVSCSNLNLPAISSCNNNPDSNKFTWDFANAVFGVCNENSNSCEVGNYNLSHQLITGKCGVECIGDDDCDKNEFCNNDYECENKKSDGKKRLSLFSVLCNSEWKCSDWGECLGDVQTRNCEDINNCEASLHKPLEIQGCSTTALNITEQVKVGSEFNFWLWFMIGIGIILLLAIIVFIVRG